LIEAYFEPVTMSFEFVEGADDEPVTLFGCVARLSVGLADGEGCRDRAVGVEAEREMAG
jgi:hypothetical protein